MVDARLTAPMGRRLEPALAGQARALAHAVPYLAMEARQVAAQVALGIHGRRRAGPGENFWQFRQYMPGESITRIDWRRSARDDRLYVREKEWQSASTYWLWIDCSPSMAYVSSLARQSKRDRAVTLALAMADLLVRSGERVGLLGLTPSLLSRQIVDRLAEGLIAGQSKVNAPLPEGFAPGPRDRILLFSDLILPEELFAHKLAAITAHGAGGVAVQIRDPAESLFPFEGETEFESPESQERWVVGDAGEIHAAYTHRLAAHEAALRDHTLKRGWRFMSHATDRTGVEALLTLATLIQSGDGSFQRGPV